MRYMGTYPGVGACPGHYGNTVQRENFEGENFRGSVGKDHFAEKTFVEC